jgi:1-acyl-sn-glycerol-3-phosphate acyltransferase
VNHFQYTILRDHGNVIVKHAKQVPDVLEFTPPSPEAVLRHNYLWNWITQPFFSGWENVPHASTNPGTLLFVGNHTLYGVDMPLLLCGLYLEKGIFLRGMGEHIHFQIPGWADFMRYYGAVDGTRENCARLMGAGQSILVYPGGGAEVFKSKNDAKYSLKWKDRMGFARLAIQFNATVIPVASVGVEDMIDIAADLPVEGFLKYLGVKKVDYTLPVPDILKKPSVQRIYFKFGEAISTAKYGGQYENLEYMTELRDIVKASLEKEINEMQVFQSQDPDRYLTDRVSHILERRKDSKEASASSKQKREKKKTSSSASSSSSSTAAVRDAIRTRSRVGSAMQKEGANEVDNVASSELAQRSKETKDPSNGESNRENWTVVRRRHRGRNG